MFGLSQCSPPTRDVTQVEAKAQTLKMGLDLNLKDVLYYRLGISPDTRYQIKLDSPWAHTLGLKFSNLTFHFGFQSNILNFNPPGNPMVM